MKNLRTVAPEERPAMGKILSLIHICVLDRMYWDAQPLSCLSNHWTAQDAADGLNYLIRTYNACLLYTSRCV